MLGFFALMAGGCVPATHGVGFTIIVAIVVV